MVETSSPSRLGCCRSSGPRRSEAGARIPRVERRCRNVARAITTPLRIMGGSRSKYYGVPGNNRSTSGWPATRPELSHIFPHRGFCTASTSLSPLPLENTGLLIVPPIRKGNCNLPSFNVAPDSRATVLVKKLSWVVISANPR